MNWKKNDHPIVQLETCYIGLGSNLASPIKQIQKAFNTLAKSHHIQLLETSSLYRSPPMGPQDQKDYINAVVKIETRLLPLPLLDTLQEIELSQGRIRKKERWSARTLDLDLLLYGNQIIDSDRLTVPHYGMTERAFVLYPLSEIASDLVFPNSESLKGQNIALLVSKMVQTNPKIEKLIKPVENSATNQGN